ncbi:hypothetical protein CL652_02575 [bacterium]|nr:hypothetical protein [bacterium]|tara:strand:+ start:16071 stop:16883 length:813 start_codon:yes stop_codon:yes gene_type:complete
MDEKDKEILANIPMATLDALVSTYPPLAIAWGLSKALFGAGLRLREDRAREWVEMVRDNPDAFTEQLLQTESFQDAFVTSLEKYIKERNVQKRVIIRKVFLGFAISQDHNEFELERYLETISDISLGSVEYLRFLDNEIIPIMFEDQEDPISTDECTVTDFQKEHQPLSKFLNKWIHDRFDPNSHSVKEKYNYVKESDSYDIPLEDVFALEEIELNKMRESLAEMVGLGIFRVTVEGGGGFGSGGGHVEHALTDFGWSFMKYLKGSTLTE